MLFRTAQLYYLTLCFKSYFCYNVEAEGVRKEDICYFSLISLWLLAFWFKGPWRNVSVDKQFYMHSMHALQGLCLKYHFYKLWLSCQPCGAVLSRPCVFTAMSRIPSCNHILHSSRYGLSKGSNPTLRRSDFVAVWVCIKLIVGLISISYLLLKIIIISYHIQHYVVPLGTGWCVPLLPVIRYNWRVRLKPFLFRSRRCGWPL